MPDQEQPAVLVKDLHKSFKLPHEQHSGVKQAIVNIFNYRRGSEKQKVLDDVSFEIKKGEFFGIVGRNGSGKSTLLKLLAGIYAPDSGLVQVNGSLTPFIELGVGFNPELTGRENVFMNGALLGFSKKEMEGMYGDIVEFAEIERFMDQKLKNYSSGMQVRLAFSIAIRAKSDILLIDEVLAVGDANFQEKCLDYFYDLKRSNQTVIFVTHDISTMQSICDRALLIKSGKIEKIGPPSKIAELYYEANSKEVAESDITQKKRITIKSLRAAKLIGNKNGLFQKHEPVTVEFEYNNPNKEDLQFGFQVFSVKNEYCFGTNTAVAGIGPFANETGKLSITLDQTLGTGEYYVTIATMNATATAIKEYESAILRFRVNTKDRDQGNVSLVHKWRIES